MTLAEEYDSYFVPAMFEPWSREIINRAKVWKGDRVLDIACGTGIVARRIAGSGAKVTGIDTSAERLAVAKRRAEEELVGVTWIERDAELLRFAAGSFDLITCQQGVQFFGNRAVALREMRRVAAPGGRCVIACWSGLERNPIYQALDEIVTRHFAPGGFAPLFTLGDEAALRGLVTAAKFFAVAVETVTRIVRFPEPERFLAATIEGAAARLAPDQPPEARAAQVAAAVADAVPATAAYREGEQLVFPTSSAIAVGRVPTA